MSIKFLLDENMPYSLIDYLEKRGFTVEHLKKIGMGGIRNGEMGSSIRRLVVKDKLPPIAIEKDNHGKLLL